MNLRLTINGKEVAREVAAHHTLLEFLRDNVGLTGTKEYCAEGECGACTVLLDGKAVNSCLVLAVETEGSAVTTIEGLEKDGQLDPLQQAFIDKGAVQCGFCIPGMILAAKYLLQENSNPTDAEIKQGLAGNLCRCAGYSRIIDAVREAGRAARQ